MTIAYIPLTSLPATGRESTIFDQVYGVRRRRPTSIHLRLSNTHRWSGSDVDRQKETYFERPSSDYTDAYLSAFAPKPISTPYFHRSAPVPFQPLSQHSMRTSPTRFHHTISRPASSFFAQTLPADTPSSALATFNAENLTPSPISRESMDRDQSSTTLASFSTVERPASPYENLQEPSPVVSSPVKVTYKPRVSFRSAPLPFLADIPSSSSTTQTVPPSLAIQEKLDRPETILFQHDEDLQLSPIVSPLLDSPLTSQSSFSEEPVTVSSKPIEILENTLNKYESLIDQISEMLASVSPLSSTISSMSPSKSVLDYELSSDSSPILPHRSVETNVSPNATARRTPSSHLIREDSYDKIVTAIADLDEELDSPMATTVIEEDPSALSTIVEEPAAFVTESSLAAETMLSSIEIALSSKKKEKRVTWDDTVMDNEDDESSSIVSEQPESADDTSEEQTVPREDSVPVCQSEQPIEVGEDDTTITDSSPVVTSTDEDQDRSSSPPETSSSFSDSLERQSSHNEYSIASSDSNNIEHLQFTPVESEWLLVTNDTVSSTPLFNTSPREPVTEVSPTD